MQTNGEDSGANFSLPSRSKFKITKDQHLVKLPQNYTMLATGLIIYLLGLICVYIMHRITNCVIVVVREGLSKPVHM